MRSPARGRSDRLRQGSVPGWAWGWLVIAIAALLAALAVFAHLIYPALVGIAVYYLALGYLFVVLPLWYLVRYLFRAIRETARLTLARSRARRRGHPLPPRRVTRQSLRRGARELLTFLALPIFLLGAGIWYAGLAVFVAVYFVYWALIGRRRDRMSGANVPPPGSAAGRLGVFNPFDEHYNPFDAAGDWPFRESPAALESHDPGTPEQR